jgi:gas vesicle protein
MADESDSTKFIWFIAGASIGAAIALLYAPSSGRELRRRIGEKTQEGGAALAERGKDLVERGKELYDRGRKLADEAADLYDRGRRLAEGPSS